MVGSHQIIIFTFSGNTRMVEAPDYHYQPPMRDLYIAHQRVPKSEGGKKLFVDNHKLRILGNYIRPLYSQLLLTTHYFSYISALSFI